jgi:hypothetical protein
MSNVTSLFGREYEFNSPLERHLVQDHLCDEGFRLGADRYYQLEAHKAVHDEDRTPLHSMRDR